MTGRLLGRYRILEKVGEGGMGEVYRARDERLERDVAVKVLPTAVAADAERLARFEREAKALARLAHPNILTIHDFGVEPRGPGATSDAPTAYAVTEFLEGETLRARLQRGPLPAGRAEEIGRAVAEGLAAAHGQGVIHRDIKPENLFLAADGRVKILDFGIARVAESDAESTTLATPATGAGLVLGTLGYMAPEQLRGLPTDSRADLFALGCVLYEMISGQRAFQGETPADTMMAILAAEPAPLRSLAPGSSPALQAVVERCLKKPPDARYASATELLHALHPPAPRRTTGSTPAQHPSIAVLPFLDLAPGRDQEYFCDGLAEELTSRLTHLNGLRVVSRTSAFAFKGKASDVREIGRQLNVGSLLEGSVQRAGDRLRVRVQLTDVADGCQSWSERFDRAAGDVFAVEDEIAQAVVSILKVKLLGGAEERAVRGRVTDPAAHDLYLQGRFHAVRRSEEGLAEARRCFERAIEIDPEYAVAHAGIAECHCVSGFIGLVPAADAFPLGRAAAEQALAIDPDLAEAHAVLGHELGMYEWRWDEAEAHFRRGLELSPGYALTRVWYSHLLTAAGRFDEAIAHMERACDDDPLAPNVHMTLGLAYYYARQNDRAIDRYLKVLEMSPSFGFARLHLGRAYIVAGDLAAALRQVEKVASAFPLALALHAGVSRALGNDEEADRALAELDAVSRRRYVGPFARVFANLNADRDARIALCTSAFEERAPNLPLINTDPLVDDLRGDPRFQALLDRLGLPRFERSFR